MRITRPYLNINDIAVHNIIAPVLDEFGLRGVFNLVVGRGADVGAAMINDARLSLISATGSTRMGRHVGTTVAKRLGRSLLELGGNSAIVVCEDADLDLALRAAVSGAVGTAGQRCTSTRRILVQRAVRKWFVAALVKAHRQVRVGDPRQEGILMGPLIDGAALEGMMAAEIGGEKETGGGREGGSDAWRAYMRPQTTTVNWGASLPLAQGIRFGLQPLPVSLPQS